MNHPSIRQKDYDVGNYGNSPDADAYLLVKKLVAGASLSEERSKLPWDLLQESYKGALETAVHNALEHSRHIADAKMVEKLYAIVRELEQHGFSRTDFGLPAAQVKGVGLRHNGAAAKNGRYLN